MAARRAETRTGGRAATTGTIAGDFALSVGMPDRPAPDSWRWTKITDVARLETGHTPSRKHPEYWGGDVPWIGIKDATSNHGRTIYDTLQHTNELGIANSSARILPENTVCLSRTASVGYVVVMGRPMATSQDFVNWVCSPELDHRFLKYVFLSEQSAFLRFASGTTHQTMYFPEVKAFYICLPTPAEQRVIGHILQTLDDKIEVNRLTSTTLEAMARALFKAWFVDFEPVRAKAEDLARNGLLEIGDGYRAKNSELGRPGLPFIRAGDLKDGFDTSGADMLHESSVAKTGTKVSQPGDVAFTSKGTIGRFARVKKYTKPFVYSPQICFWRSLEKTRLHPAVLYCWMRSNDFLGQVEAVAGQTDMAPYVSLRDQRAMEVPIFPENQFGIGQRLEDLLDRQAVACGENITLAALRDTLLPELISGDLRVKDAETFLDRVL